MDIREINNRFNYIQIFIIVIGMIIFGKIIYLNVVEGSYYQNVADGSIYKDITIPAPRGEIRDKNGVLLAGNKPVFTVKVSKHEIERSAQNREEKRQKLNEVAFELSRILIQNNETMEDNFPILIQGDVYSFSYDEQIAKWKAENAIDANVGAKEAFQIIVDRYASSYPGKITGNMSILEIQKLLNEAGYYPPISITGNMDFTRNLDKKQWLARYSIRQEDITAKEAFLKIRENMQIEKSLTNQEARNILVITDAIEAKGYLQYEPALVSKDISQKTVALIEENIVNMPGVSVQVEPLRYYPQGSLAAHVIGQIGKISASDEKYLKDKRYSKSDYVGKSGIEAVYEEELKGSNGYEKVLVDSAGKKIKDIDYKEGHAGNTVYLSIDARLQKVAETALEKTLKKLQEGGIYESDWGNMKMAGNTKIYKNANAGAIVALDVNTGKVLALASYPSYDPNMFTNGLTKAQFESLQPENPNDPLSPKPLFNAATMTAVQPGSIFKMISAMAGLENGLDPYYTIEDKGFIELAGVPFGNWLWNESRQTQGLENVITALRDSNNYYFYCISTGYDYAIDKNIPMQDMRKGQAILDMAKKFGLDKKTGIEIYEVAGKIPNPEVKYEQQRAQLNNDITIKMKNRFIDINPKDNEEEYNRRIGVIISWIDENPSRAEIINRLVKLKVKKEELEKTADLLKYTYFINAEWSTGDVFNMAIGQGEHQYTPLQIANYISAIANGGYLNSVSVIEQIEDMKTGEKKKIEKNRKKIDLKNMQNYEYIKKGMVDVTDEGTAKAIFEKFPIKVAAKTGTAETQGKIPTKDEVGYYLSHVADYGVDRNEVIELAKKLKLESKYEYKEEHYIQSAIIRLNPDMSLDKMNRFKETYGDFSWFVAYAPYDKPQIAVVTLLFQGGSGGHAGPATRDVIAQYMGINTEEVKLKDEKEDVKIKVEQNEDNAKKVPTYTLPEENIYVPTQEQEQQWQYQPPVNTVDSTPTHPIAESSPSIEEEENGAEEIPKEPQMSNDGENIEKLENSDDGQDAVETVKEPEGTPTREGSPEESIIF